MDVLAILSSDLHFCHVAPVARSAEPDWYEAMLRPIQQVEALMKQHRAIWVVAGDVFDRWNSNAELTNFLLDNLPKCYGIAGQHDLPFHVHDDMHRASLGTLVRAGKFKYLDPQQPTVFGSSLKIWSYPWNHEIKPCQDKTDVKVKLAVCHAYIWKDTPGYPGVGEEKSVPGYRKRLEGYDAAVFGDNHKGFLVGKPGSQQILNGGTFLCRKKDEREYKPHVGLLYEDGHIELHYLDTSKDRWLEEQTTLPVAAPDFDVSSFIDSLKELGSDALDFRATVNHLMDDRKVDKNVRKIVLEAVG